jgi:hypothetical protein
MAWVVASWLPSSVVPVAAQLSGEEAVPVQKPSSHSAREALQTKTSHFNSFKRMAREIQWPFLAKRFRRSGDIRVSSIIKFAF